MREAMILIEKFAMLCSTPGIDQETQKLANEEIQRLITQVVKPELIKMSASAKGLII